MNVEIDENFSAEFDEHTNQINLSTSFANEMTCFTSLTEQNTKDLIAFLSECLSGGFKPFE